MVIGFIALVIVIYGIIEAIIPFSLEWILVLCFLSCMLILFISMGFVCTLEINVQTIVTNGFGVRNRKEIPYNKITRIYHSRDNRGMGSGYTIQADLNGKIVNINLLIFNNQKRILRDVISMVNRSIVIVENDVLRDLKM